MVCRALAFGLVPRQVQSLRRYNSAPLVAQTAVNSISTRRLFFVGTALLPGKPPASIPPRSHGQEPGKQLYAFQEYLPWDCSAGKKNHNRIG